MSGRINRSKVLFILVASSLGACFLCPPAGGEPRAADERPPANRQEPFVVLVHWDDGQWRLSKYLLGKRVTEDIGTIPASDLPRLPAIGVLPNHDVPGIKSRPDLEIPEPIRYLDWRTLTLFDPKDVPEAETNPIPLGYWDRVWLLGVQEDRGGPAARRVQLMLGRRESLVTLGHMGPSSPLSSLIHLHLQWSPDGRFFAWFDEGEVHWLDLATANHGVAGNGDAVMWLRDSSGFVVWSESADADSIAWRVQWLLGPNAAECMQGSRNGLPSSVSPDGRFLAITTGEFPNPPRRVVPIPGAVRGDTGSTQVNRQWRVEGGDEVEYFYTDRNHGKWFAITQNSCESHDVGGYGLTGYDLTGVHFLSAENGGRLAIVFYEKSGLAAGSSCIVLVSDFEGREIFRADADIGNTLSVGGYLFLLRYLDGWQFALKRFNLNSGEGVVVLRHMGSDSTCLESTGGYLLARQVLEPPSLPDKTQPGLTHQLLVSSDLGTTWTQIADKVGQWHLGGGWAPSWRIMIQHDIRSTGSARPSSPPTARPFRSAIDFCPHTRAA